jgi:hypothetical protein
MNKLFRTSACVVLLFSLISCTISFSGKLGSETIRGSGPVVEEERDLGNITGVVLSMPGTLYVEMGISEALRVEADENLLEYIETNVRGNTLVIETRQGVNIMTSHDINFYLTVDELESLETSSSGDIEAQDLRTNDFSIQVSSSGNVTIASLNCLKFNTQISSSGEVTISDLRGDSTSVGISSSGNLEIKGGQVQTQNINISSSGEYLARNLESLEAKVNISSSGSATIWVKDQLSGNISSSGNIYYYGDPEVNVSTSSSGEVKQIK